MKPTMQPGDNRCSVMVNSEYRASAERLISAACYMADPKTGRKLREHWQREFKKQLAEHETRFPNEVL
jgi:hypothetical protein